MVESQIKPDNRKPRSIPSNDLDMQMQTLNPKWEDVQEDLKGLLLSPTGQTTENGEAVYKKLASLLTLYTRDWRLGNLVKKPQFDYVSDWLALSFELNEFEDPESSILALNNALSVLEPSSSIDGFARRQINTRREESVSGQLETERKGLMFPSKQF